MVVVPRSDHQGAAVGNARMPFLPGIGPSSNVVHSHGSPTLRQNATFNGDGLTPAIRPAG
jgi:hypothetical protein